MDRSGTHHNDILNIINDLFVGQIGFYILFQDIFCNVQPFGHWHFLDLIENTGNGISLTPGTAVIINLAGRCHRLNTFCIFTDTAVTKSLRSVQRVFSSFYIAVLGRTDIVGGIQICSLRFCELNLHTADIIDDGFKCIKADFNVSI